MSHEDPTTQGRGEIRSAADDRFTHGLLEFVHRDSESDQAARIDRVMNRVRAGNGPSVPLAFSVWTRRLAPIAALVLVVGLITVFSVSTERSAYAVVNDAILATDLATDLRYEIRVEPPRHEGQDLLTIGTMDIRGELSVIRIRTPEGHLLVVGADDQGPWAIRRDGSVTRYAHARARPRWIDFGESVLLIDALGDSLRGLPDIYTLERAEGDVRPDGKPGTVIIATRDLAEDDAGPERVEIWIDAGSNLVDRMELRWPGRETPEGDRSRGGHEGPPRRHHAGPRHEQAGRPDGLPPPRPEDRPLRDAGDGPFAPAEGRPRARPSRFMDGPPRRDRGDHPPPPRRIVFQRTATPAQEAGWYSPESHDH